MVFLETNMVVLVKIEVFTKALHSTPAVGFVLFE